jgi:hypothetical protein
MLAWMDCGDGRQTARASPFRVGKRTFEIGGWYEIEHHEFEKQDWFRITYHPTEGSPDKVEIASTLGDAHVQAETHYEGLRSVAMVKTEKPLGDTMKKVKRGKWRSRDGQEHEHVAIAHESSTIACSLTLDEAEQVGSELLRLAAEWRQELAGMPKGGEEEGEK